MKDPMAATGSYQSFAAAFSSLAAEGEGHLLEALEAPRLPAAAADEGPSTDFAAAFASLAAEGEGHLRPKAFAEEPAAEVASAVACLGRERAPPHVPHSAGSHLTTAAHAPSERAVRTRRQVPLCVAYPAAAPRWPQNAAHVAAVAAGVAASAAADTTAGQDERAPAIPSPAGGARDDSPASETEEIARLRRELASCRAEKSAGDRTIARLRAQAAQGTRGQNRGTMVEKGNKEAGGVGGDKGQRVATCLGCGAVGRVLRCGGCQSAAYCSRDCQRKHWRTHKATCSGLSGREEARDSAHRAFASAAAWSDGPSVDR